MAEQGSNSRLSLSSVLKVFCFGSLFVALMMLVGCSSNNKVVSDEAKALLGVTGFSSHNTSACTDSDGGKNYDVKGTTSGPNYAGVYGTFTDFCFLKDGKPTGKVNEGFCSSNGKWYALAYNCSLAGKVCKDGKCVGVVQSAVCGNGVKEGTEQCDDGNTVNNDRCSSTCQNEPTPVCGNGIVEGAEACDDGNRVSGDGCRSDCRIRHYCEGNVLINVTTPNPVSNSGACYSTRTDSWIEWGSGWWGGTVGPCASPDPYCRNTTQECSRRVCDGTAYEFGNQLTCAGVPILTTGNRGPGCMNCGAPICQRAANYTVRDIYIGGADKYSDNDLAIHACGGDVYLGRLNGTGCDYLTERGQYCDGAILLNSSNLSASGTFVYNRTDCAALPSGPFTCQDLTIPRSPNPDVRPPVAFALCAKCGAPICKVLATSRILVLEAGCESYPYSTAVQIGTVTGSNCP